METQGVKISIHNRVPIGNLLGRTNFEQPITVLCDRVAFGLTKGKDVRSRNNRRSCICDEVVEVTVVRDCGFFY